MVMAHWCLSDFSLQSCNFACLVFELSSQASYQRGALGCRRRLVGIYREAALDGICMRISKLARCRAGDGKGRSLSIGAALVHEEKRNQLTVVCFPELHERPVEPKFSLICGGGFFRLPPIVVCPV